MRYIDPDWQIRLNAIPKTVKYIMKCGNLSKNAIRSIFDDFATRCNDGNSKVALRALTALQEIISIIKV